MIKTFDCEDCDICVDSVSIPLRVIKTKKVRPASEWLFEVSIPLRVIKTYVKFLPVKEWNSFQFH